MGSSSILRRSAELAAAAVVGGAVVLGGVALFGGLGGHTTTVREIVSSPGTSPASFVNQDHALSINDIYNRAAPGVVQVSTTSVVDVNPTDPFGLPIPGFQTQETQKALGSGFVWDKAGHI